MLQLAIWHNYTEGGTTQCYIWQYGTIIHTVGGTTQYYSGQYGTIIQ